MASTYQIAWEFERFLSGEDEEPIYIDAVVSYRYSPGCPARINCEPDYGWDAEPAEVEVEEITRPNGKTLIVGTDEWEVLKEHLIQAPPDMEPDPDYAYERMRDEREFA